jgi:hypothetical protein
MNSIALINNVIESPIFIILSISVGTIVTVYGIINMASNIGRKFLDGIKVVAGGVAGNAVYDVLKNKAGSGNSDSGNSGSGNSGSGNSGSGDSGSGNSGSGDSGSGNSGSNSNSGKS